jgi:3-dehydrotetronate 4-kinase
MVPKPWLGIIADDFTGAVDVATGITQVGHHVVIATAQQDLARIQADVIVIALKTRSIDSDQAVNVSLNAAQQLIEAGVDQIYFKYCSTFDSTSQGNIGPVSDALADLLDANIVIFNPAFPANGRVVRDGNLYVNDVLLEDSPMRNHPLNPMTKSHLPTLLDQQSKYKSATVPLTEIRSGLMSTLMKSANTSGTRYFVTDSETENDLSLVASECTIHPLVTGGSALAAALAAHRKPLESHLSSWSGTGRIAIIVGSTSAVTQRQVDHFRSVNPDNIYCLTWDEPNTTVSDALAFLAGCDPHQPVLVTSYRSIEDVLELQARFGTQEAAHMVEEANVTLAKELVRQGITRLMVAGGESSGAVVTGLGVTRLKIAQQISPGLAWAITDTGIALALKSGNFGSDDLFASQSEM